MTDQAFYWKLLLTNSVSSLLLSLYVHMYVSLNGIQNIHKAYMHIFALISIP